MTSAKHAVQGGTPAYKAWHQTRRYPIGESGARADHTELIAVHAVGVQEGDQAVETPCGLVVLVDVTGEACFDMIRPSIRCEMCAEALGLPLPDKVALTS